MTVTPHSTPTRAATARAGARPGLRARVAAWVDARRVHGWTREATALTVLTAALLLVGLVMSFSASFVDAAEGGDPFGVFRRQLVWAALGIPVFVFAASLDHRVWRGLSWPMMAVSLVGLIVVLVPGIGVTVYGSTRWIGLGPFVVQPSELAKIATVLWLADVIARKRRDDRELTLSHLLVPALPLLGLQSLLVMLEPDLGTTILLAVIVALVLWIEGIPMRLVGTGLALGGVLVAAATVAAPYRMARISGWLHPEADPQGAGFQLLQGLFALGSGGWFGLGLGSSRGKWNYIPNPETDFIFAIIGEELGLVGALATLALFGALLVVGLHVAGTVRDRFGRTVAFVVTAWLVGQAMLNIGTVTGLLPITGVTLPLVSVGGSSLVSTLLALGILVAIARRGDTSDDLDPTPVRPV
ncbi:MAG: putative lipid II flippase FtsW [Actinomycetes bacterium]